MLFPITLLLDNEVRTHLHMSQFVEANYIHVEQKKHYASRVMFLQFIFDLAFEFIFDLALFYMREESTN